MCLTPKLTNGSNGSFNSRQKIEMTSKLDGPWPGKKEGRREYNRMAENDERKSTCS